MNNYVLNLSIEIRTCSMIVKHQKCDRPRENRPSLHLGMIVEIPVLKVLISITSFCSC